MGGPSILAASYEASVPWLMARLSSRSDSVQGSWDARYRTSWVAGVLLRDGWEIGQVEFGSLWGRTFLRERDVMMWALSWESLLMDVVWDLGH